MGGFGGILAYGLQQMDGIANHPGWAWMFVSILICYALTMLTRLVFLRFIWEGVITVIIAILSYIFLVDFPEQAHRNKFFLNNEELQIMIDRVDQDRGGFTVDSASNLC